MRMFRDFRQCNWLTLTSIAAGFGFPITHYFGTGEAFGVEIKWDYTPHANTLTLWVLNPGLLGTPEAALDWLQQNVVDPAMQAAPTPSR